MSLHNDIMNIPAIPSKVNGVNYILTYKEGHRDARHAAAELSLKYDSLLEVTLLMREYIDALPNDLVLPVMHGFDRDWADEIIERCKE